jgi:hypothetical protein
MVLYTVYDTSSFAVQVCSFNLSLSSFAPPQMPSDYENVLRPRRCCDYWRGGQNAGRDGRQAPVGVDHLSAKRNTFTIVYELAILLWPEDDGFGSN